MLYIELSAPNCKDAATSLTTCLNVDFALCAGITSLVLDERERRKAVITETLEDLRDGFNPV